ncbi:MAG TPA: helix-turn-helix transcriptional regulator [Allosphingosinicella sp.]|nr:helix-turn-helix transcriptional regulator [Allosphingosinicella sp.]
MSIGVQGFVGARLTEARRARGLSATDLAGLIGVSVQSISRYENGSARAPCSTSSINSKLVPTCRAVISCAP